MYGEPLGSPFVILPATAATAGSVAATTVSREETQNATKNKNRNWEHRVHLLSLL